MIEKGRTVCVGLLGFFGVGLILTLPFCGHEYPWMRQIQSALVVGFCAMQLASLCLSITISAAQRKENQPTPPIEDRKEER